MEKVISIEFNSEGTKIDEQVDEIRQGDKGVVVEAKFEDKNNANYIARINFTRPDGSHIDNILMSPDSSDSEKYTKKLDSLWYFAKSGGSIPATLTVFLVDGQGNQLANGQVSVSVQKTDYSEDPSITPDQYEELIELIATKLNIKDGIIVADTVSALDNLEDYEVGQLFYIRANGKIYQLNSSYNLDTVIDLYLVNFTILNEVEVVETKTANQVKKTILLKNPENQTFYDFEVVFNVATTSDAGLMSANDKGKLNDLPTNAELEQTYETKEHANASHQDLQEQIDAIIDKADVVDIVGTYAELLEYDTSKLGDNDIIKVLVDETKQNQRSYYRWNKTDAQFDYIGSEGLFYTKAESDQLFLKKIDAQNTYQIKNKTLDHIPQANELEEGQLAVVPSIEPLTDVVIGGGLEIRLDAQSGAKTLKTVFYKHDMTTSIGRFIFGNRKSTRFTGGSVGGVVEAELRMFNTGITYIDSNDIEYSGIVNSYGLLIINQNCEISLLSMSTLYDATITSDTVSRYF